MEVRTALNSDLDSIIRLDPLSKTDPLRAPFITRSVNSGICYVVVERDQIVGYGVLEHSFYDNGFIAMLYVHPDFRRKGYASALLNTMENECKTEKIFTSTNVSNQPMQSLLPLRGYELSGYIENLDEGDPELVYFKRLG